MYTLDTISPATIKFSATMNIKLGDSVMNIVSALSYNGRNTFTAADIAYVINRNVKASWNKVTEVQVERVIKAEIKCNSRGEVRKGFKAITSIGYGNYQYGK